MTTKMKVSVIALFSLLGITGFCSASTIFTDDFNAYTISTNLNGQGDWIASSSVNIGNFPVKEGSAAVSMTDFFNTGQGARKTGAMRNDGQITIYLRRHIGGTTNPHFKIILREGTDSRIEFRTGGLDFRYWNGSNFVNFGPWFASDTWYALQTQWRSSDHKVRYNIDGGVWTDWVSASSNWSLGIDTVDITGTNGATYFDTIQENLIGQEKNPVLIVPGIMGTELFNNSEKLWMDAFRMLTDIGDDFMDQLQFEDDLNPKNSNVSYGQVISTELTFDYTDGFINELKNQGYVENETLFTFPYDWRYGVSGKFEDGTTVVDLLEQKINQILAETGKDKVDVVAHSLGGLLVKEYVINNPTNHHIDKAVFVGVPNTGAPEAIKTLLEGDDFGIPWLSEKEIKKIAENMPAVYDLLPTQKYYDAKGSFVKVIDQRNFTLSNPEVTVTDLTYDQFEDYIALDHELNATGFTNSENLHLQSFDDFDLRTAGVDLYAINGCRAATATNIIEKRSKNILGFEIVNYDVKFGAGDSTVPLESATNLPIDQDNKYYALKSDHSKMLSADGMRQQIVNILSGSDLGVSENIITQNIEECELNGNAISVFSPVDISVIDQDGHYVGLAEDGSITNEIANATLEILGDHKFLYLPTDQGQTYQISIKGTGNGSFTIKNQEIIGNEVIKTEVFSNLPVTKELIGQITLGNSTTLLIQQNAGSPQETILPLSIVNAEQSEDLLPPISTVEVTGTLGQPNFYRSDVVIDIKANDVVIIGEEGQTSGVLHIHYVLDNSDLQTIDGSSVSILVAEEGNHEILFFSTDNAGNNEPQGVISFTIDKTPPEAIIEFNPGAKDVTFSGADDISQAPSLLVNSQGQTVTITDEAGNFITIGLEKKTVKSVISNEITSIEYNGIAVDMSKNRMIFLWNIDKSGSIKMLSQYVKSNDGYNILAVYDGSKTKIVGNDSSGKVSKTVSGLQIIKILTKEGDLLWSY